MKKKNYGSTVNQIIEAIQTCGPMTRTELCNYIKADRNSAAAVVSRMNKPTRTLPKRLYICGYVYDQEGQRFYPRAVYDIGDKPDVKSPGAKRKEVVTRYRTRKKMRYATNSVFNLQYL